MRSRRGIFCMVAGAVLLLSALGLTAYNICDEHRANRVAEEIFQELKAQTPDLEEEALPEEMIPDYILNPGMGMPVVAIDGEDYIGYLDIPVLDLYLPVMSSWSYPHLKIAPCCYAGSAYLDNFIIAAHNYDRHFGRLKTLQAGDLVRFTDVDGNVFSYAVASLEQLEPYQASVMKEPGDWALTMFTCTVGGQHRVTVRCTRLEEA